MAKTCGASIFQPPPNPPSLPFPPKGPQHIPSLTMSSSLTPTNTSEGTPTHFFPSHMENNKQLPDKEIRSSFWETAKTLQYMLGNDQIF